MLGSLPTSEADKIGAPFLCPNIVNDAPVFAPVRRGSAAIRGEQGSSAQPSKGLLAVDVLQ